MAAAVDWLRISVGIAQNVGRYAAAIHAMENSPTESGVERGCAIRPSKPIAAINIGTAECQCLAWPLAECHALSCMTTTVARYSTAPSTPTSKSENPD